MFLAILTYQLATLLIARGQNACIGHSTFRSPDNSDIEVFCGSQTVDLQILLCPIYFNGYNESLLALNSEHSKHQCKGTPDWTVDPPVVKFNFSITEEAISACSSDLTVTEEVGTGVFADFSNVQFITISGMVCSEDPSTGAITYHQEVMYRFSCHYPLQYLVNNTQMSVYFKGSSHRVIESDLVNIQPDCIDHKWTAQEALMMHVRSDPSDHIQRSAVSLAVKDNNGSFISTLSMHLYSDLEYHYFNSGTCLTEGQDNSYSSMLRIPPRGLELKTRIFVEVKASNLTNRFNVLLDRCYATASPFPLNTTYHDLFVGCNQDVQTVMEVNGELQVARFSFETFRFIQSIETTLSTYYVHCATRLCVNTYCPSLTQNCTSASSSRRRRSLSNDQGTTVSDMATISSGPITTRLDTGDLMTSGGAQHAQMNSSVLAVSMVATILGAVSLSLVALFVYRRYNSNISFNKTTLS